MNKDEAFYLVGINISSGNGIVISREYETVDLNGTFEAEDLRAILYLLEHDD